MHAEIGGCWSGAYGRMSFARRAMQLETALRLPALAMQLSNLVKTVVLWATNVPKRTENATATASARTPQMIPATACPGFVAPLVLPRVTAMPPRTAATRPPSRPRGNKMNDRAATRLATPTTRAATPRPFLGRADGGVTRGCADSGTCGVLTMPTSRLRLMCLANTTRSHVQDGRAAHRPPGELSPMSAGRLFSDRSVRGRCVMDFNGPRVGARRVRLVVVGSRSS